jgi:hypothetical protein
MGDLIVGAGLATVGSNAARSGTLLDAKLETLVLDVGGILTPRGAEPLALDSLTDEVLLPLRQKALALLSSDGVHPPRRPFHWLVEFPEVFLSTERPGFDALAGNPPFIGGQKITGLFGTDYRDYLVQYHADGRRGSADFCAYFFLRAAGIVREGGNFGLLAVNTIAEGDTRQVGLEAMLRDGLSIYAASPNFSWPGAAAISASAVHCHRGSWLGQFNLSGNSVPRISAFLSAEDEWSPKRLASNENASFIGSYVLGMGFTLTPTDAAAHISRDSKNAGVIHPYVNGEDLNTHPEQKASRWVINFWDWPLARDAEGEWNSSDSDQREQWFRDGRVPQDYPGRVAEDYPELIDVVRRLVLPERLEKSDATSRKRWWLYARPRPELYHRIGRGHAFSKHPDEWSKETALRHVYAISRVTKFVAPAICSPNQVFSDRVVVFVDDSFDGFALLCSSIHEIWVRKNASTFETRLTYTPSDVFETLPMPTKFASGLAYLGQSFAEGRSAYCLEHQEGLTDFYNDFHDPSIQAAEMVSLRQLSVRIDKEMMSSFEWNDVDLGHEFHSVSYLPQNDRLRFTMSEAARLRVLELLGKLNRERYAEEQAQQAQLEIAAAAARPAGAPRRGRRTTHVDQGGLF